MKRIQLLIILLLIASAGARAQNLVPDPGFEITDTCPTTFGQINCLFMTMPFTPTLTTWSNPNVTSPDYFNTCGDSMLSIPVNLGGYQPSHSGNGYTGVVFYDKSGFESWSNNYREYLQCELTMPLVAGKTYRVSYFVSLSTIDSNRNWMALDNFHASLTAGPSEAMGTPLTNSHIVLQQADGGFVTDTANWTEVFGYYTASGGEKWLTIGLFYDGGAPTSIRARPLMPAPLNINSCYYYVDDAAVVLCDTTVVTFDTTLPCSSSAVLIAGSALPHLWSTGSNADTIKVNSSGTYWCHSAQGCTVHIDSFYVNIAQPVLSRDFRLGNDTIVCSTDELMVGRRIPQVHFTWNTADTACCISPARTGTYSVIADDGCIQVEDSVHVTINDCDNCLFIPTAFTPNGDGLNDLFAVSNRCQLAFFHMQVFDRWGELIYEMMNTSNQWDGTYKGQPMQVGVYYFTAQYTGDLRRGIKIIKGDITLIR